MFGETMTARNNILQFTGSNKVPNSTTSRMQQAAQLVEDLAFDLAEKIDAQQAGMLISFSHELSLMAKATS